MSKKSGAAEAFPKILVFDLDGTLWYPEMYMLWSGGGAPFKSHQTRKDALVDRGGTKVELMGNSFELMRQFINDPIYRDQGVTFAVASTCDEPEWAEECMRKFVVDQGRNMADLFNFVEIYKASSKQEHFRNIQRKAKDHYGEEVAFSDMIFFDNQTNNTTAVSRLGVHCVYTPEGMTEEHWSKGINEWRQKSNKL